MALEVGGSSPLIHPGSVMGFRNLTGSVFGIERPHRLVVRSSPFQGGSTGSNPVGVTLKALFFAGTGLFLIHESQISFSL